MTLLIRSLFTALVLFAGVMFDASSAELVVIVSARSTAPALRSDQVAAIFLGQSAQLPDGAYVTAIDQQVGSGIRDDFYVRVAAKSPALLKAYWSKLLFTGRGQPPREANGNATVKKLVAESPGLIGYIERSALDPTVRPVLVVP
jgi:ABC-type phosphate transport system substrate-binding protein